jgi:four helix bundle protein
MEMSIVERFEDLRVWQESRVYSNGLHDTTDSLSDFPFRDQMSRAAISIMNNIAEGIERSTDADFVRFLDIAKGSSGEVRSMLNLGEDRNFLKDTKAQRLRDSAERISKGVASLTTCLRPR